jgi:FK506-binding protein 2
MRSLPLVLPALAFLISLAAASTSSAGLEIDITYPVECTRKTKKGDNVDMHYRGTLASDGSEFDASYNRGTPLSFQLGAGRVIKGSVPLPRCIP